MKYDDYAEEWANLYKEELLSFSEIGRRYNTTARTVLRTIQDMVEIRPKSPYDKYGEEWENLFLNRGYSKSDIAKQYETSVGTVLKVLQRRGIKPNPTLSKQKYAEYSKEWAKRYEAGESLKEIGDKAGVNVETIRQYVMREGTETRSYSESIRKFEIDDHYFDLVDTKLKAYHLGLAFSIGTLLEDLNLHMLNLSCQEETREIADKLIGVLGETSVYHRKKGEITIRYCSKHLFDTLMQWGLLLNKDKSMTFPDLPSELTSSFVLGYWEGRGTYASGKRSYASFSGSQPFLEKLLPILIDVSDDDLLEVVRDKVKNSARIRFSKYQTYSKILRWLYQDNPFYTESRKPSFMFDG